MAWTNWGFDGTINEAQWAQMAGLLGNGYVAAGNGDCLVTAVGGARSVSVAAGTLYGDGVVSVNSGAETVAMTTPVNGQWYVIALRRTWATNTAALVAIAGATTTTTTPTAPPTSFPTLNTNVGVLTDQPIAWAWCNSANTTVVVYDIRLKAVKSLPPVVANGTERDAKFMTPTQGLQVWRDDLGVVETYLGLYNASTNPGGGDVAGWTSKPRQFGLVPVKPSSVGISGGSATVSAVGEVVFTGTSGLTLNNIFTSAYRNYFILISGLKSATGAPSIFCRYLDSAGSPVTTNNYYQGGNYIGGNTSYVLNNTDISYFNLTTTLDSSPYGKIVLEVDNPANTVDTLFQVKFTGWGGANNSQNSGGFVATAAAYSGITFYAATGTQISGQVTIYGYNK